MDLVIILEISTCKTPQNYDMMLTNTTYFLRQSDIDGGSVRIGVLAYSGKIKITFNLNAYSTQREVIDAIERIPYIYDKRNRNRTGSIQTMRDIMFTSGNGDRPNVENVCIIITDDFTDDRMEQTLFQGINAIERGITIYGLSNTGLTESKEAFVTKLLKTKVPLYKFEEIPDLAGSIFLTNCLVDNEQCTPNPCPDGANCTSTEGNYTCLCTVGYMYNGSHCVTVKLQLSGTTRLGVSRNWLLVMGSSVGAVGIVIIVVTAILVQKRKAMSLCFRPGPVPAGQEPSGQMSAGQVDAGRPPGPAYMYSSDSLPGTPVVRQSRINMSDEYTD